MTTPNWVVSQQGRLFGNIRSKDDVPRVAAVVALVLPSNPSFVDNGRIDLFHILCSALDAVHVLHVDFRYAIGVENRQP